MNAPALFLRNALLNFIHICYNFQHEKSGMGAAFKFFRPVPFSRNTPRNSDRNEV